MKIEDNKVGKNEFHVMMNSVNINKIVWIECLREVGG